MFKFIAPALVGLTLIGCASPDQKQPSVEVIHHGALKNMMHKNDISAKFDLATITDTAHLYALGALENLKGEILILDGQPFMATATGNEVTIDHSYNHKATLWVQTKVTQWTTVEVPNTVSTYAQLEDFVANAAKEKGLSTDAPFPFLLNGTAAEVEWHVINWKEGDTEHSHEKHITSGPHGTLKDQPLQILGFYSEHHHAIFTHHTTNMHLHMITRDQKLAGHVDGLTLGEGMVFKLPKL